MKDKGNNYAKSSLNIILQHSSHCVLEAVYMDSVQDRERCVMVSCRPPTAVWSLGGWQADTAGYLHCRNWQAQQVSLLTAQPVVKYLSGATYFECSETMVMVFFYCRFLQVLPACTEDEKLLRYYTFSQQVIEGTEMYQNLNPGLNTS